MMTWEEAIVFLSQYIDNDCYTEKCQEAHRMAVTTLCPVSREQVEKVWRGEWIPVEDNAFYNRCRKCGKIAIGKHSFCRNCGAPMTDEAVQMVMERLEALKDGSTTD